MKNLSEKLPNFSQYYSPMQMMCTLSVGPGLKLKLKSWGSHRASWSANKAVKAIKLGPGWVRFRLSNRLPPGQNPSWSQSQSQRVKVQICGHPTPPHYSSSRLWIQFNPKVRPGVASS